MKTVVLRPILIILILLAAAVKGSANDADFDRGVAAYAAGDFDKAASLFLQAAQKTPSAGAWHNLGNAEWKKGSAGAAVLAWERALWIDPYLADAKMNLQFIRRSAQLPSPDITWWEACSMWLPVNSWGWIASVCFWISVALMVLPGVFRRQKTGWHQGFASAGFALFLITLPALAGVDARSRTGVVLVKETPLRLTPTLEAQTTARLQAGETVVCLRTHGHYRLIRTTNGGLGWVEATQVGIIAER